MHVVTSCSSIGPGAATSRSNRPHHAARVALTLGLACTVACGGTTPAGISAPASVTPAASPCTNDTAAAGPSTDPLSLVGGEGIIFGRVDLAAIRASRFGGLAERALDAMLRAELSTEERDVIADGLARTEVLAFAVGESGVRLVAQGRYTEADLAPLRMDERRSRRQHVIHLRRRDSAAVLNERYLVFAERWGVEAVLDRLDQLEDPMPPSRPLLEAQAQASAYRSYFSVASIPNGALRREFEREEGLAGVFGDLRWATFSVVPASEGVSVMGRVHTVTASGARAVLDKALEVQAELAADLEREVPELANAVRALEMGVDGSDATLRWQPTDAAVRRAAEALIGALESDAQRRAAYRRTAVTEASSPP